MNRKPGEWLELMSRGKSATLEFMNKLPADGVVVRTLTAFSNTDGGVIVFGVSSKGDIVGLTEKEVNKTIVKLDSLASSLFSWPCEFGSVDINGKHLAYIAVSRAPEHLFPMTTSTGTSYVRQEASNCKASLAVAGERPPRQGGATGQSGESPLTMKKERTVTVFVAMSFRREEVPALEDYYDAIEGAIQKSGLPIKLVRADLVEGDFEISQNLMDNIDEADIVIADFTLKSPNVYFELGYARGRKKRVIQIALKDTVLEFDVRNWRTINYRNAIDLKTKLVPTLEAAYAEVTLGK